MILFVFVMALMLSLCQCELLRESKAFLVLCTLLAWSGLHGRELIYFDYILFSFRVVLRALIFSVIFFSFAGRPENIGFALLCYLLWLPLSLACKYFLYRPVGKSKFLVIDPELLAVYQSQKHYYYDLLPQEYSSIDMTEYRALVVEMDKEYSKPIRKFIAHCKAVGVEVLTDSDFEEQYFRRVNAEVLDSALLENSFTVNRTYLHCKQAFDVLFTLVISPLLLLLSGVIALCILVTMGRPILFTQERFGQDGKRFNIYKFRSMRHEKKGEQRETDKEDARVTRLGKLLRKFRLDELPQFINILRGEMSLIGPRPEWEFTAKKFSQEIPVYYIRHTVKPGITGWAQVQMGHATGVDENFAKLRYDLFYVKYLSFWLDTKIVLKTLYTILTGFGAK